MSISSDGRHVFVKVLRPGDNINISEDGDEFTTAVVDTHCGRMLYFEPSNSPIYCASRPAALYARAARDPDLLGRLYRQAAGRDADAANGEQLMATVSDDGRYWAYWTDRRSPVLIGHRDRTTAPALVVRDVESGRIVATAAGEFGIAAFGPGADTLSLLTYRDAEAPWNVSPPYRFRRWDLSSGHLTGDRCLSYGNSHRPQLTTDGRYAIIRSHEWPQVRAFVAETGDPLPLPYRFVRDDQGPDDPESVRGVFCGDIRLNFWNPSASGDGFTVAEVNGLYLTFAPAGVAADGSVVALVEHADTLARQLGWGRLDRLLDRVGWDWRSRPSLRLFETAAGRERVRLSDAGGGAAFSADGRTLVVLGGGGALRIYDWPLRTPWLPILGFAALLAGAVGITDFAVRRLRRWLTGCARGAR